jgi:hypothetical protein
MQAQLDEDAFAQLWAAGTTTASDVAVNEALSNTFYE